MSSKKVLEPTITLFIDINGIRNINIVVVDFNCKVLELTYVSKANSLYLIRKNFMTVLKQLIEKYPIDMIVMEQNKLFIDKIDRHPDPLVLRNVQLGFGIKTSIEDTYWNDKILLEIPEYEWKSKILNTSVKYSIDLYKSHILERQISEILPLKLEESDYYKVLCFSESIFYNTLMHRKYQINQK